MLKKRRESVVYFTDPRVDYLFGDDSCFTNSKEAHEIHFTALKKTLPIIGQIIPKKRESRSRLFLLPKKGQWRVPLFGNLGYNFLLRIHTKLNVKILHNSSEGIDKDSN
jgi:hypothetical protein